MNHVRKLSALRLLDPAAFRRALANRAPAALAPGRPLLIIAADHPARGVVGAGADPFAMASRDDLLDRCLTALSRPGVDGFVGTADMVEDLAVLGGLDGKLVFGSMNRGGLHGACFEVDDRYTGYDPDGVADGGVDGGKLLLRIDYSDPASADALEAAARAVRGLVRRGKRAMVEPFVTRRDGRRVVPDLSTDAAIRAVVIASGLGASSAYTWLKVPLVEDMARVMAATTLPALVLGGEVSSDPAAKRRRWAEAVRLPNVHGLVVGRSLLFPADGDVAAAVDQVVEVL